jgi:hypothetical protein
LIRAGHRDPAWFRFRSLGVRGEIDRRSAAGTGFDFRDPMRCINPERDTSRELATGAGEAGAGRRGIEYRKDGGNGRMSGQV